MAQHGSSTLELVSSPEMHGISRSPELRRHGVEVVLEVRHGSSTLELQSSPEMHGLSRSPELRRRGVEVGLVAPFGSKVNQKRP